MKRLWAWFPHFPPPGAHARAERPGAAAALAAGGHERAARARQDLRGGVLPPAHAALRRRHGGVVSNGVICNGAPFHGALYIMAHHLMVRAYSG